MADPRSVAQEDRPEQRTGSHARQPKQQQSAGTGTMKAVRFHGKEDLRYEDVPIVKCGRGQIMIAPAWCGICGSDLHEVRPSPSLSHSHVRGRVSPSHLQ